MAVIIKALSIMLNIYTFLTILSIGCVILLILKIKAIALKLDISLMMQVKRATTKDTIITLLKCMFMPGFHAVFSLLVILFCLINNDKTAELINTIARKVIEEQQEEEIDNE